MGKVRLGDIFEYMPKSKIKAGEGKKAGKYKFFTSSNIQDKYIDEFIYDGEYLIFGTGGKASINYCNERFSTSTDNFVVKVKKDINTKFVYLYFKNDMQKLENGFKGASIKHISKEYINQLMIPMYDLKMQEKIVKNLDKIQEIIDIREKQIEQLDGLIKSQFVEMFGIPFLNEKRWKMGTIRDLVSEVKYGTSKPANGGKYKYLRMNNITYDGNLDLNDIKYINISEDETEKYTTKKGDILFNRTNSRDLVGKTCVFNLEEKMVIAGFIIRVRVNDLANPYFISTYLNTIYLKNKLYNMCKNASGQSNINAQELQNIEIYIPPIDLQNRFAEFVKQIDKQKFEIQKSLEEAQKLQESLMNKYFG